MTLSVSRPWRAQALTFGLLQQGRDAVGVHGRRAQLHQGQEEGLQRGVQGLEQGEAQAQALDGHVCGARGPVRLGSQQSEAETPFVNELRWSLPTVDFIPQCA